MENKDLLARIKQLERKNATLTEQDLDQKN
jgi:hypothetical protein